MVLLLYIRTLDNNQGKKAGSRICIELLSNLDALSAAVGFPVVGSSLPVGPIFCFLVPIALIVKDLLDVTDNMAADDRIPDGFLQLTVHDALVNHPVAGFGLRKT